MIISYYDNTEAKVPIQYGVWEIKDLLSSDQIKELTFNCNKGEKKKEQLPIVTLSCSMQKGEKKANNITNHSGLIWLDVDKKDNEDIENKYLSIKKDKYTNMCWHTLNGGLRVIINTNCINVNDHFDYWNQIKEYYSITYNIVVDTHCSNVKSFSYVNYVKEEDIYSNVYSTTFTEKEFNKTFIKKYQNDVKRNNNKNATERAKKNLIHINISSLRIDLDNLKMRQNVLKRKYNIIARSVAFYDFYYDNLKYKTEIDESFFIDKQQPVYIASGIDSCRIELYKSLRIEEGKRNKMIGYFSSCLLFLNKQTTFTQLFNAVKKINKDHCFPKLPANEVYQICKNNYDKFKSGEMNFDKIIKRKYVFYSKEYVNELTEEQIEKIENFDGDKLAMFSKFKAINKMKLTKKTKKIGMQKENEKKIYEMVESMQNEKINTSIIANKMNVSKRTIERILKENQDLKNYIKDLNQ
jgi:hypothetical protein